MLNAKTKPVKPIKGEPLLRFMRLGKVSVDEIVRNELNPRQVFPAAEIEDLKESILRMGGVLVPLVVYEKGDKYVLLDGERRWLACKQLASQDKRFARVPVNIIHEPKSDLQNLLTMFSIHENREPWKTAETAKALGSFIQESGIKDSERLAAVTSLRTRTINDLKVFLELPKDLQERAINRELDAWHLIAIRKNLIRCQDAFPAVVDSYGFDQAIRAFVRKVDDGWIKNYREFEALRRIVKTCLAYKEEPLFAKAFSMLMDKTDFTPKNAEALVSQELEPKSDLLFQSHCSSFLTALEVYATSSRRIPEDIRSIVKRIREGIESLLERTK